MLDLALLEFPQQVPQHLPAAAFLCRRLKFRADDDKGVDAHGGYRFHDLAPPGRLFLVAPVEAFAAPNEQAAEKLTDVIAPVVG